MVSSIASSAAIPRRLNSGQVYQLIDKYRIRASAGTTEKLRRAILKGLYRQLTKEMRKAQKPDPETNLFLERSLMQVKFIVKNDCRTAHKLLTAGPERRDRSVREGLYLYQSVCR